jgi:hypothetical protein
MILLGKVSGSSAAELPPAMHQLTDSNLRDPVQA